MSRLPVWISVGLLPCLGSMAQTVPRAAGTTPLESASAIMARVAANQDRTEAERAHFVYLQRAHVQSRKGDTVLCEEVTEVRVTPSEHGQRQSLLSLSGRVRDKDRVVHYTAFPAGLVPASSPDKPSGDRDEHSTDINIGDKETVLDADASNTPVTVNSTDISMVEHMRQDFTSDKMSKDGLHAGLFPLTTDEQKQLDFTLKGREQRNGRDTFHIVFRPKDTSDIGWKGDAWIDTTAYQPVAVRTALSRSLPMGVRMLLGTNVPGLGFTVIYAPQANDVWFPTSFGTEFKIKVLFLFHRQIVVDVQNHSFERTHVTSTIHADAGKPVVDRDGIGTPPQP